MLILNVIRYIALLVSKVAFMPQTQEKQAYFITNGLFLSQ